MIHAYAILTGYIAMRGSLIIHLGMFIAMIAFVRFPDGEVLELSFPGGKIWYWFALLMHLILSFLQFTIIMKISVPLETFK